jgi:hypothetical protein
MDNNMIMARSLAPEDIRVGAYVVTLHLQSQFLLFNELPTGEPEIIVHPVVRRPCETQLPRKVVSVCLPFVVVRNHERKTEMLDARSVRLARVSKEFAKAALKPHIKSREAKSRRCRCECSGNRSK